MNGTLAQNLWAAGGLLVGFAIVMFTLALLWGLTALMARVIARLESRAAAAAAVSTRTSAPAPMGAPDGAPSDEELAALAAAVALLLDRPHRVLRVLPQPSAWGQQGRRDAHSSHRMT